MADVKTLVDEKIAGHKVMLFSKSYCPFCKKAKAIMQKHLDDGSLAAADYGLLEIDLRDDTDAIQDYIKTIVGKRSVPQGFVNGKSIGGCDDITKLDNEGQLVAKFNE